jgi:hypothetical protein
MLLDRLIPSLREANARTQSIPSYHRFAPHGIPSAFQSTTVSTSSIHHEFQDSSDIFAFKRPFGPLSAKTAASQSDRPIFRISDFPISIHRFASTTSQKRFHPERLKARHLSHDARPAFAFSLCSQQHSIPFDTSHRWHKPTATLRLNAPTVSRLPKYTRRLYPLSKVPFFG